MLGQHLRVLGAGDTKINKTLSKGSLHLIGKTDVEGVAPQAEGDGVCR